MRFEGAACYGADPMLWFPTAGDHGREAKRICATCSCTKQCLEYALTTHNSHGDFGIWGGTSVRERMVLRRGAA